MIKKTHEQNDNIFGLTEWWELSKNYESVIFIKELKGTLQLSDNLRSKLVKSRHIDPVGVIYPILIKEYNLSEADYELEKTVYDSGAICFPIEKKMEVLEMIDQIIKENSIC